mmetsp:Transcript_15716/g.20528  ORF Transcript_15716/g.20528 Transcript_15716/m.20528 type:complete len:229 (+) Transcript_15716:109-795(+)
MRSATLIVAGSALFVGRLHAVLSLVSRSPQARLHYCDYSPSNCLLSSSALLMSEAEKGGRAKSINGQNGSFSNFSSPMKEEAKNGSNAVEEKRVVVTISFSADSGLRPFYLTTAKLIKESFPDVLIEKRVLPSAAENEKGYFEIQVDGKVVVTNKGRSKQGELGKTQNVFVSMNAISSMIVKARRRRRPSTVYAIDKVGVDGEMGVDGVDAATVRLNLLRQKAKRNFG